MSEITNALDPYLRWVQAYVPTRLLLTMLIAAVAGATLGQLQVRLRKLCRRDFTRWIGVRVTMLVWLSLSWLWLDGTLDRSGATLLSFFQH